MPSIPAMRSIAAAVRAGTAAWTASLLAALLYIAPDGWQGAGDLPAMAGRSLAFAGAAAVVALGFNRFHLRSALGAHLAAAVLGPALGLGSFLVVVQLRGGWIAAFPVFTCWAFGGLVALLATCGRQYPHARWMAEGLAMLGLVALLYTHATLRRLG